MTEKEMKSEQERLVQMESQLKRVQSVLIAVDTAKQCTSRMAEIKLSGDGYTTSISISQGYIIAGLNLALQEEQRKLKVMGYTGVEVLGEQHQD